MHIAEGVLSVPVLACGGAVAAAGVLAGLHRLDPEDIPRVGLLSAAFFVGSLIHFPLGPVSVHLLLTGFLGILLGLAAVPAILAALLLQALLFQHGGFTALGANTVIMALPAVMVGYAWRPFRAVNRRGLRIGVAFLCGAGAVLLAAVLMATALLASGEAFRDVAGIVTIAHLPVAALEGFITATAIGFLDVVKPEVLAFHGRRT